MLYNLTFSSSIFESLGVLSTFNIVETIWDDYERFAIPKVKESTLKLRGSLYYLKDLSPKEAGKELNILNPIMPILSTVRNIIEPLQDKDIQDFLIDYFDIDMSQAGFKSNNPISFGKLGRFLV